MNLEHYHIVKKDIENKAQLCVVSKGRSVSEIKEFYELNERIFAENRANELLEKIPQLPNDIEWHFIGHLQRNKVKAILPYISLLQSLDSYALAEVIEKEANILNKEIDVLLEVHLATEDTNKNGFTKEELFAFFNDRNKFPHIHIKGIMVMGPNTDDTSRIKEVFLEAKEIFTNLQKEDSTLSILSLGMSADYPIALECGSTMVRIGTYLFMEDDA